MADGEERGGEGEEKVAAAEERRDWSELTPVCLANVFRRLTLEDRWNGAMLVCRAWLDAARDPSLFESFDLEPAFDAAGSGRPDHPAWWTPAFRRRVDSMLRFAAHCAAGSLWEIRVRHCSDDALSFSTERSPNLQTLSIRSSQNVTDRSMFKVASCCPMLRELDISNCYEISYRALEVIGQKCPNLTILKRNLLNWLDPSQHAGIVPDEYLRACPQDGDQEAEAIARFMPKLKHLELRFSKLTISGLVSISKGCGDLEELDLFGCANLTSRGIEQASTNLKNLKTLTKPNFYIPRSVFHTERYGHWRLYDERFQTNVFQI
ncbi:F-box protein SKIP1 [Elaeis guineensis]|uniref:F-box protein SKIP1 n=1 Tax=Elaeis guineensis var. tenera TaxID=51953 RepID=A0A6I9Q7T5_ELAGV|nr:F-box protein SKIP1 [Elaeis guineensis]